jgi:ABC-type enterobactin transport system permease subunit
LEVAPVLPVVIIPEPPEAAIATHLCIQVELPAEFAVPIGLNVSPATVGVLMIVALSSEAATTTITSPVSHVNDAPTFCGVVAVCHVDV